MCAVNERQKMRLLAIVEGHTLRELDTEELVALRERICDRVTAVGCPIGLSSNDRREAQARIEGQLLCRDDGEEGWDEGDPEDFRDEDLAIEFGRLYRS